HFCGGKLLCHYLRHAHSVLRVHELDGTYLRDIPLPGLVSVAGSRHEERGIEGRPGSDVVHFPVTSFAEPGALWWHTLRPSKPGPLHPSTAAIGSADSLTEQVFVTSDDGPEVPMFLPRRRLLSATGEVPVLFYGYGGFDFAIPPSF